MSTHAPAVGSAPSAAAFQSPKRQFLDTLAREGATTLRVLRAFPADQLELRPSEKSKTARELAWLMAIELGLAERALESELRLGGGMPPAPEELGAIIAAFEERLASFTRRLEETPDDALLGTVQFPVAPRTMGDWQRLQFIWFILHDHIHHRGQLSVYMRLAGARLPSIYGPTADEPWM